MEDWLKKNRIIVFLRHYSIHISATKTIFRSHTSFRELGTNFTIEHIPLMKQIFTDEVRVCRQDRKQTPTKKVVLQFSNACKKALADGEVTPDEEKQLKSLAKFLKIQKETMKRIFGHEARVYKKTH